MSVSATPPPARIARVAVPSPLYRCFDYSIPDDWDTVGLLPGSRLRVPFGRRRVIGLLVELRTDTEVSPGQLKPVLECLDQTALLPADIMALLAWAQDYYHHPPGEIYLAAIPTLLRRGKNAQPTPLTLWKLSEQGRRALDSKSVLRAPRQRLLLEYLRAHPGGVAGEQLRQAVPGWSRSAQNLLAKHWVERMTTVSLPKPIPTATAPLLAAAQQEAVAAISAELDHFAAFLLDGVTGSGKTEVYLRVIETVLAQGRQVLVLVPEIGLTPQLLARFQNRLPTPLAVLHSALAERERLEAWLAARAARAGVVIGTRSAIFAPLPRLGLIVIDEEHDLSFKQQDGFRYHARDLAVVRARHADIPIVLGSATPSLESLFNVRRGRYRRLHLPERVGGAAEPTITPLDLRRRQLAEGLSEPLLERMQRHLEHDTQVLLFLNRRGFAPTLICHDCGWISQCRLCDARMTVHLRRKRMICHHCGAQRNIVESCPECGGRDLRALGQGTERIEQVLRLRFPEYGIARMDRDSTRRKGSLQTLLDDIHSGARKILIGTQMLAKGHHFPEVTLVGIIDADQGLFGTDFRSGERMAQLILQVSGRAGRAEKPGIVVVQTHHPNHPLLLTLIEQGYTAFAEASLLEREKAGLPPYSYQALLRADADKAELPIAFLDAATALGTEQGLAVELLGPAPAPMERRAGRFRAQLLIQARNRTLLHQFLRAWIPAICGLKSARKVRWSLDVDPMELS